MSFIQKSFFFVEKCGVTQVKSHTHDQKSLMHQWVFLASSGTLATKHGKFIFSKEERVIKAELINVIHYADSRNTYASSYDNIVSFFSYKSFAFFVRLSKNTPYLGKSGKFKCYSISLPENMSIKNYFFQMHSNY